MKVVWLTKAMEERVAIFDYIEIDSPGNALRVDERILAASRLLEEFPSIGLRRNGKPGRKLVLADIGFILFYQLRHDQVEITSIVRAARRPARS